MARRLKVYQTSLGFFDLAVAAPSMKAALESWGSTANLFHQGFARETDDPAVVCACPYGSQGDLLWVRETFCLVDDSTLDPQGKEWIDYRATPRYAASHPAGWHEAPDDAERLKWSPSIFMPRLPISILR